MSRRLNSRVIAGGAACSCLFLVAAITILILASGAPLYEILWNDTKGNGSVKYTFFPYKIEQDSACSTAVSNADYYWACVKVVKEIHNNRTLFDNTQAVCELDNKILLGDPLPPNLADIDPASRKYVASFAKSTCEDLTSVDAALAVHRLMAFAAGIFAFCGVFAVMIGAHQGFQSTFMWGLGLGLSFFAAAVLGGLIPLDHFWVFSTFHDQLDDVKNLKVERSGPLYGWWYVCAALGAAGLSMIIFVLTIPRKMRVQQTGPNVFYGVLPAAYAATLSGKEEFVFEADDEGKPLLSDVAVLSSKPDDV
ncbi:MAG: uncharacterized protein KVP18_002572 [Porospora cf. gigantea A]|uniref:uncharacterized protein n=1 Tax=Porospora cf. gigantea A TaxID=2853593 RepID=UPI00355A347A|nr:MAG: hypothetical protein KVP18_002572 [Porospora cf. gigantea A]